MGRERHNHWSGRFRFGKDGNSLEKGLFPKGDGEQRQFGLQMHLVCSATRFLYVRIMGHYKSRFCRLKVIFFSFICFFCRCGGGDYRERKSRHPCHKAVVVVGIILLCNDFSGAIDYCRLDVSSIECSSTFLRVL